MSVCTRFVLAILVTSLGSGFQHGYHIGVLNVPAKVLQKWISHIKIHEEEAEEPKRKELSLLWSTAVATHSIGGILGSFMIGIFVDSLGRKQSLQFNNFIALVAAPTMFFSKKAKSYKMLIMGRFIAGINSGLNMGLCQIYLSEISPDKIRGAVGSLYQFAISCSILVSQIAGVFLGSEDNWPYIFLLPVIPALFQFFLLFFCPESPKFLITQLRDRKALRALMLLRSEQDAIDEFEMLKEEDSLAKQLRGFSLKQILRNQVMSNVLSCCLVLNVAQQMCGKNALTYFSVEIMENMGLASSAVYSTIGMNILSSIATLGAILTVDNFGRRPLMKISLIGTILTTFFLFISLYLAENVLHDLKYLSVGIVCLFHIFFSIGIGPIAVFITAELFTNTNRTIAVILATATNWSSNFIIGQAFLALDVQNKSSFSVTLKKSFLERNRLLHVLGFPSLGHFFLLLHPPPLARNRKTQFDSNIQNVRH
ncbi:solute carrier family 2, facilitated glucose transporter member 1-like [Tribolium madens]|uniref:solute carrier family 2, facilitated glucose transporter member 1-like n=1 Tax=Tribolium madens TaxID=41895 RepID=UPI001CF71ED8|nr:solute carrier family 2, facilitated glucose transporter member 1-like [Tribolium madens]